ncbi:MAG TPA: hypothetical protein PKW82_11945 [Spirochaetales bacterium]|nr:hypothetical protein [Spirochaetales bacterium]
MYHPKMVEFDAKLKALFDRIDHELEDRWHGEFALRWNRPERGETANPESDGLFNVQAYFTPGFGSKLGRGYGVDIDIATHEEVPPETRSEIEDFVRERLESLLPGSFPDRALRVERDGPIWKIVGDLSLGRA